MLKRGERGYYTARPFSLTNELFPVRFLFMSYFMNLFNLVFYPLLHIENYTLIAYMIMFMLGMWVFNQIMKNGRF